MRLKNLDYICTPLAGVVELVDTLDLGSRQEKVVKIFKIAGVVELVDTPDLGSGAARCGSSSLPTRTKIRREIFGFFYLIQLHF